MIKYTLTSPTFELASTDLKVILKMFEDCVCDECKVTQEEYFINNWFEDDEKIDKEVLDTLFPDNYNDLTDEEKINILLSTQCGAEFIFETVEDLEVA